MDAAEEHEGGLLNLNQILPPRLEDAGLEDCALPPDSIREAFFKAASAVKSRATSFLTSDETDGHCVEDPWPTDADEHTDVVIGISPWREPPAPCATGKGASLPEFGRDEVVVGGDEMDGGEGADKVVVGGMEGEGLKACVDGCQGLEIGAMKKKDNKGDEGEEDESKEAEKPILGEGFA